MEKITQTDTWQTRPQNWFKAHCSRRQTARQTAKQKMATSKEPNAFEVAPLRTLDDFLLESARFQVPNVRDFEKWGKRVYSNLIYYQSNYFLLALALFTLVGWAIVVWKCLQCDVNVFFFFLNLLFRLIHPFKMFLGLFAIGLACGLFVAAGNGGPQIVKFKQEHPVVSIFTLLMGAYLIIYLLDGILVFLLGILLPFCGRLLFTVAKDSLKHSLFYFLNL